MKNKAHDLKTYRFIPGEKILVDANVWLYLYPPPMNATVAFARQYSNAFAQMIKVGASPVMDPMVMSEYLNRYCRIEWSGQFQTTYPNFKNFRNSSDFRSVAETAAFFARQILALCLIHDVPANGSNLPKAIADFETGDMDFNDGLLANVCKNKGFKLLTNDGDFQTGGIEVLTSNPKLLRSCN